MSCRRRGRVGGGKRWGGGRGGRGLSKAPPAVAVDLLEAEVRPRQAVECRPFKPGRFEIAEEKNLAESIKRLKNLQMINLTKKYREIICYGK